MKKQTNDIKKPYHVHNHNSHDLSNHHTPKKFTKAFVLAIVINLLFVIAEVVYALIANSVSLLADAGHNFIDVVGLAMSAIAMFLLKKRGDAKYSYGFKRATIMAALLNAVLLIATTLIIAIDSINKLLHPVAMQEGIVMIVAAVGVFVNGGTALFFMHGQDDINIKSAFLHLAYDALLSLGIVVVAALTLWTHWLWLDPLVGILIAIIIFYGSWGLLRQSLDLSLDAVPHTINYTQVLDYLQQLPMVRAVHHLHIWSLSTREVALTVHLVVPDKNLDDENMEKIHYELREKFKIHHVTLQVEQGLQSKACGTC